MDAPRTGSGGGSASDTSWLRYGYSVRHNFKCDLKLLQSKDPLFYELYLVDMARDGCSTFEGEDKQECLIPVPVLNKALRSRDAQSVNKMVGPRMGMMTFSCDGSRCSILSLEEMRSTMKMLINLNYLDLPWRSLLE